MKLLAYLDLSRIAGDRYTPDPSFFEAIKPDGDSVTLINSDGTKKTFAIDADTRSLNAKGIKTFFKKHSTGAAILEREGESEFRIDSQKKILSHDDRTNDVLNRLLVPSNPQDGLWFDLYSQAREFSSTSAQDSLVCLDSLDKIQKLDYQISTVRKVVGEFRGRALLCDEVGLGKTIEALMATTEYIMRGSVSKILILTPAPLVKQWHEQTTAIFNLDFMRADDPLLKKQGSKLWGSHDKLIASIDHAKRSPNREAILAQRYDLVIIDEAHRLKNTKSVAWSFVNSINKRYIFLLTATPVQNNLDELFNLITLLKPGQLRTYAYFKKNFVADKQGLSLKNSSQLKALLEGVMIRNRRSTSGLKLPMRYASTSKVAFSPKEKTLYEKVSNFVRQNLGGTSFTRMTLRNIQERAGSSFGALADTLASSQSPALHAFLGEARELEGNANGKLVKVAAIIREAKTKVIVFTKYLKTLELISSYLKENGIACETLSGSMPKREKERRLERFAGETDTLVSTGVGSEGLNLQFCHVMVNFDLPWNPMEIEQRIGRVHRIGQESDVIVHNLSYRDTIEDYILDLLEKKINMFELAIGETDMILGETEDDEDFAAAAFNAWAGADNDELARMNMDLLGEKISESKKAYDRVKDIDEALFSGMANESQ